MMQMIEIIGEIEISVTVDSRRMDDHESQNYIPQGPGTAAATRN
jgi:hypothetical protein